MTVLDVFSWLPAKEISIEELHGGNELLGLITRERMRL